MSIGSLEDWFPFYKIPLGIRTRGGSYATVESSSATTALPGQDNPGPSTAMSPPSSFVVCCGLRLSEVGSPKIRKPQVARSIRVAGSIFLSFVHIVDWAT